MKRAITVIAAAASLAPAAAAAQTHDHVVASRVVLVRQQTEAERRAQERARQNEERARQQKERERARADQNRRDYREEQTEKVSRTFKIGSSGELDLANLAGDIVVTRGGGNSVQIEAVKIARARTVEEAREMLALVTIEFSERASRAEVKTEYGRREERQRGSRNINVSVDYTVVAPENTRISVNTLSGSIRVSDIKGDLNLSSLSGNVVIENAARVASAKSTSGNVEITNVRSQIGLEASSTSGNLMIRHSSAPRMELGTVSGNVDIADVTSGRVEAQTISGSVDFASPLEKDGRYELNSHSGVVRFTVTGNTGFELEASSFSGHIQTNLTLKDQRQASGNFNRRGPEGRVRSLQGTYGDGSAVVEITTFSGTVIVGKR